MKKYKIICNSGSLEGGGHMQDDVEEIIMAETEQQARSQFSGGRYNQMYGRRIKSIQEIAEQ